jgi:enoyl-CoA hydratase/carnithine racemase
MPGRVGLFLALTAAQMNAADCIYTGIADRFIENAHKDAVIEQLLAIDWQQDSQRHGEQITAVLRPFEQQSQSARPADNVAEHFALIQQLTDQDSFYDIVDAIIAYQSDDSWVTAASAALKNGSPISACNIVQTLAETRQMSLAEVFQYELMLATNMVRHPEFAEGVRALLIDKDKSPKWQYPSVREVPAALLQQMITPPWTDNPIADL